MRIICLKRHGWSALIYLHNNGLLIELFPPLLHQNLTSGLTAAVSLPPPSVTDRLSVVTIIALCILQLSQSLKLDTFACVTNLMSNRIWNQSGSSFLEKMQSNCRAVWFYSGMLCITYICFWVDLFVEAEIQIKKAISFTTFHCCHSLLNHKSSVMTDFVCCAGMSGGRAEEACGARWAMTDVGRTPKMHLSHRNGVFWVGMVAADRWLCGRVRAGTLPMLGF